MEDSPHVGEKFSFSSIGARRSSFSTEALALQAKVPWYAKLMADEDADPETLAAIRSRFPLSGPIIDLQGPAGEEDPESPGSPGSPSGAGAWAGMPQGARRGY